MKDKETPLGLVRLWQKMRPDVYEQLDNCKGAKSEGEMDWPDYCLLPINAAFTYLVYACELTPEEAATLAAELTACWTWRQNKIIYWVDDSIAALLAEQAQDMTDTDILPAELLMHLPYPCIYVKAHFLPDIDGFWAWVDFDTNRNGPELRIQWVTADMKHSNPRVLHLIPGATLGECIADTAQETAKNTQRPLEISSVKDIAKTILSAVQIILYIVSDGADIETEPPAFTPRAVSQRKKKNEDKAANIDTKLVGVRMGAAIRRARLRTEKEYAEGTGHRVRSHARRGHWHHYWTGPKDGKRKLILKWTAPTMIHPEDDDDENVVVFEIKK